MEISIHKCAENSSEYHIPNIVFCLADELIFFLRYAIVSRTRLGFCVLTCFSEIWSDISFWLMVRIFAMIKIAIVYFPSITVSGTD